MPLPILYDSFSSLVSGIKLRRAREDNAASIYYFETTFHVPHLAMVINDCELDSEDVAALTNRLCDATEDGRIFWRSHSEDETHLRFVQMLRVARSINRHIPFWSRMDHPDAHWYIPAMRRFLGFQVIYGTPLLSFQPELEQVDHAATHSL